MSSTPEPYAAALAAWMAAVTGTRTNAFGERLSGATTATIVPFTTADGAACVAKIYDRRITGVGGNDVTRDAAAMRAATEVGLTVPRLIDADPDGDRLGWPALLMTRLPGEPLAFGGDDPNGWTDGLADELIDIGNAALPSSPLAPYQSWLPERVETPDWSNKPSLWAAVAKALAAEISASTPRLVHRDFHPLNVLWAGGQATGSVDWVNGCLGPIESDIASCRVNIALADRRYDGVALAQRFLDRCLVAGLPWDPVWDLDFIAGVTDRPEMFLVGQDLGAELTFESVCNALETMATKALDTRG
jgi:Ser/Thr protein kinase RdoA (MazF antagonist)